MNRFPKHITKYFWGDDLKNLSWEQHQDYIAKTILENGDQPAVAWLFEQMSKSELKQIVKKHLLEPKSKNFWSLYLS